MSDRPLAPSRVEYNQQYVLRPVEPSDVLQIESALQKSLKQLQTYMSWAHHLQDRQKFLDRVVTQWWNYFKGYEYEMALFEKKSGEFLVYSGFYPTVRINPNCYEIGFWTTLDHQGKGLATLVTQMQIALIFEFFHGDRIEITCNVTNEASRRVIEKCGFQYEGELRNYYPQGTTHMFENGYTHERRVALFSLIPEDRPSLSWYDSMLEKLTIFPFLDNPLTLSGRR